MVYTTISSLKTEEYQGNLKKAITYLKENYQEFSTKEVGKYEIDATFYYMIQEYVSKDIVPWESHEKYIDIQLILVGEEKMNVSHLKMLTQIGDYNEEKDCFTYEGKVYISLEMHEGDLAIFFPEDAHQPGLKTEKGNTPIRKCVFKVLI